MAPNTDPRDARVALLERLFQSAVGRADALEREVATLQEEKRVLQAAAERAEALEPTNNAAERAIRRAVLWRKGSFGNDSINGSRFGERVLTAVATVRLRHGSVLGYLTQACTDYRKTGTSPSLLTVGLCA